MKEFVITKNDSGQRADKFISKAVPNLPQSLLYKFIRTKRIKLNGKRCDISTKLQVGDVFEMYINDEFFENDTKAEYEFLNARQELNIVYEDENILLVYKKSGLVVHEDDTGEKDTLINRILRYLYEKGDYNPDDELSFIPALCNRLDRNTEGIVIAAKNAESLRVLNEKIKNREIEKKYLCVCVGKLPKSEDTLKAFLFKDSKKNTVYVTEKSVVGSKSIVTHYKVLKENNNLSLVEIELMTGRTHQIRAQFAHIGNPLLGDGKYGINKINREYGVKSQILCAYKLKFDFKTDAMPLNYLNGKGFEYMDDKFERRIEEMFKE